MTEPIRVLLPVRPDNDCSDPARLIDTLFGHENVRVLRLFVYRAAELEVLDSEMLVAIPEIRRLDESAIDEAQETVKKHCSALKETGFQVESAIVEGFPVETILAEAVAWGSDLIVAHVPHEISEANRIGRIAGALIDASPVPVLVYHAVPQSIGTRMAVLVDLNEQGECALKWASVFASRTHAQVHAVHTVVQHLLRRESTEEAERRLKEMIEKSGGAATPHVMPSRSVAAGLGEVIDREHCDLVIVPSHHSFAPSMVGSPDRRIIEQTDVPVVLVPLPDKVDPDVLRRKIA